MPEHTNKKATSHTDLSQVAESTHTKTHQTESPKPALEPIAPSVIWDIPGDVPGERSRPVHRPAVSPVDTPRVQLTSESSHTAPTVKNEATKNPEPVATIEVVDNSRAAGTQQHAVAAQVVSANTSSGNKSRVAAGMILLLVLAGLTGAGYELLFNRVVQPLVSSDEARFANVVSPALATSAEHPETIEPAVPAIQKVALASDSVQEKPRAAEKSAANLQQEPVSQIRFITHVVVKGDTLWDISKKYLKNPFRYPELAKLSKIQNPDLIYPGDIVRIQI